MPLLLAGIVGIAFAAAGGRLFVRGAVGVAHNLRIPPGIIGATVAAFATSSPELAVAMSAAFAGSPAISFGDAIGSNIVNVALVLAVAIAFAGLRIERQDAVRDLPLGAAAPAIIGLLLLDGRLGRADGAVLIAVFVAWLAISIGQVIRSRDPTSSVLGERHPKRAAAQAALGIALLLLAGRLVVIAAEGLGEALGLDEFVVGATLVAFGTSTPELATVIASRASHHDEVGVGTVLGSNLFNSLLVVGLVALVAPFEAGGFDVVLGLTASVLVVLALLPWPSTWLGRGRGVALLCGYAVYAALLFSLR